MQYIKTALYLIILISISFIFGESLLPKTYAQSPFVTLYDISYDIANSGNTSVKQHISIVNKQKDVIANTYSLLINKMNIYNLEVDSDQNISVEEKRESDTTEINLEFNNAVIGEGKANEFIISYTTNDIASKVGEVWNINIPKANLLEDTKNYNISLKVPKEFGPEIFITPDPLLKEETENAYTYSFNKNILDKTGISGSFGQYQVLNFKLDYEISNNSHLETERTIALPPDLLNIQQIVYKSLDPRPYKITNDNDNNVLAHYKLDGKETINVTLIGTARILSRQINPEFGGEKSDIPNELLGTYTSSNELWNANDPEINQIATDLYDQSLTVSQNAQNAYQYVISNLSYDFEILGQDYVDRKGGKAALNETQNIGCMEYTDLLISIVRAMGIPARELNGYAIAGNDSTTTPLSINLKGGDLLHSWVEFYDPEFGWVPVDPTWGSTSGIDYFTKLDTNHLVFVVKGDNPYLPLPAGAYKTNESQKQVQVDFASEINEQDFTPKLKIYPAINVNPLRFVTKKEKYYLKNEGHISIYFEDQRIVPSRYLPINIKDNNFTITIKDTLGKEFKVTPEVATETLDNPIVIYGSLILGVLLLCMIYYFLIIHLKVQKKLPRHPVRRLLGRDQQPNQH